MQTRFQMINWFRGVKEVLMDASAVEVENVDRVFSVKDYATSKNILEMIADSFWWLLMKAYLADSEMASVTAENLNSLKLILDNPSYQKNWVHLQTSEELEELLKGFNEFLSRRSAENANIKFWSLFIQHLYPIGRDKTQAHR